MRSGSNEIMSEWVTVVNKTSAPIPAFTVLTVKEGNQDQFSVDVCRDAVPFALLTTFLPPGDGAAGYFKLYVANLYFSGVAVCGELIYADRSNGQPTAYSAKYSIGMFMGSGESPQPALIRIPNYSSQ